MFGQAGYRYLARQFARPQGLAGRLIFGVWLNKVSRGMNALALRLLEVRPTDRVLEVGFGGGALLAAALAFRPTELVGVDLSEQMVARGRKRFRREIFEQRVRLIAASVDTLPLGDESIDKACSLNSIYFWENSELALRELARVIRPGGMLILGFEAPETLRAWPGHRYGFSVWRPEEVVSLAEQTGFGNAQVHEGLEPKFGKIYCVKVERR